MEFKTTRHEFKANRSQRTLEGYAATFEEPENYDSWGDIIAPGASLEDLAERGPEGKDRIKVLYQHSWGTPIGKPTKMAEDSTGILVEGKLSKVQAADEALVLIEDKVIDSLSIGYETLGYEILTEHPTKWGYPVRKITKLKLFEFSPVTFPANENARITGLKHWHQTESGIFVPMIKLKAFGAALGISLDRLLGQLQDDEPFEDKAGRVISAKNLDRLISARDAIETVITAAKTDTDDAADGNDGNDEEAKAMAELLGQATEINRRMAGQHGGE
ncbi:MAG TPA: HK97 family phage prohead protease [Thermoanaerobaculia bacterium]|nr:HK97 family phage prohead protease [Thermoanaerobaculia bacterium]